MQTPTGKKDIVPTTSSGSPFVVFDSFLVKDINEEARLIFSQEVTCILHSMLLCNQTSSDIKVFLYIAQNEASSGDPDIVYYPIQSNFKLGGNETIDWFFQKNPKFITPRQTLYAYSDSDSFFNVDISYRKLTELSET